MDRQDLTISDKASHIGSVSRRTFIQGSAAAAALTVIPGWLGSAVYAQGEPVLKLALIGCGGRGKGAVKNALEAALGLGLKAQVVAVCDYFDYRAQTVGEEHGVPVEQRFSGPAGYHQLLKADADIVILATPPLFRPIHLDASVDAGKHVFMEKPVAVDAAGCRQVIAAGERAAAKGLSIVAGTQRRHQLNCRKYAQATHDGAIGEIVAGQIYWCQNRLWYKERNPGESDPDYLIRNWVNFVEMSGDHIVEQHVHQIDLANWFIGRPPVSAVGFGGRERRITGNQYDHFNVSFDYGEGCTIHSMCRQIDGCWNRVDGVFTGTEGRVWAERRIVRYDGSEATIPELKGSDKGYVEEHVDLQSAVINSDPINEARQVAESTLAGIMGRISAYTGQMVRWDDLVNNQDSPWYNMTMSPSAADFESGIVTVPEEEVAEIPGA